MSKVCEWKGQVLHGIRKCLIISEGSGLDVYKVTNISKGRDQ